MVMFSTLGWLSGQSERVLLGMWAGTAALGAYSFGSAVGRSAGEAIAASQPTVLRADLSRGDAPSNYELRQILGRNLRGGLYLTVGNAIAIIFISTFILPAVIDEQWNSALQMAPILALSAIPSAVAQSTAPVFIQKGRAQISYIAPAICLFFAPLVAVAALSSLTLAAWAVLLRECVLATIQSILLGRATPWPEVWLALTLVAAGSLTVATVVL
jgi:O-antigen/teichoic acid export membrane protein